MIPKIKLTLGVVLALAFHAPAAEPPSANTAPEERKEVAPFSVTVTGSGRPMILIPGLSCAGNVWDGTVAHFQDRYECHVVTLAGFAGQPPMGEKFLEPVRDSLIRYIREKHLDRPIVIGHSLGGFMAFWIGATAPEAVGPIVTVDGMPFYPALLDSTATAQSVRPQAEGMRDMFRSQGLGQFVFGIRMFLGASITAPEDIEKVAAGCAKSDPKAVADAFYELMTNDLRPKVAAIRTPVLVLGATALMSNPAQKQRTEDNYRSQVATIAQHKVVFAAKAKHFIQLDEPDFFYREVETFLKETGAPAAGQAAAKAPVVKPTLADVAYGPHPRQILDFYQATSDKPTPIVFAIHGGGWLNGDKSVFNDPARYLAAGISVVAIDYRFIPDAEAEKVMPPVKAPLQDAARALQFVRSKAAEWNIDKQRIGATGSSAGACSSLWLAFHPDMADPKSDDPVARESTRLWCVAVVKAQTSLDPAQMKEWIPNNNYGAHAFGFKGDPAQKLAPADQFLAQRETILSYIAEYSPYGLVSADDPPVYLGYYTPPALGQPQESPAHSANFGVKLQEKCREAGVPCELVYPGSPEVKHASAMLYLIEKLKAPAAKP